MSITIAVPRETASGERRVAIVPSVIKQLDKLGVTLRMQRGAGEAGGFTDDLYEGATLVDDTSALYDGADIVLRVQPPSVEEAGKLPEGSLLLGFLTPHEGDSRIKNLQKRRVSSFALELVPRITRAQGIDALSSQGNIAGYKCALMAAHLSPKLFPMLTTAAGTVRPARVVVVGAGVAGLQAIATAKRLGAIVEAYDVRAATKEQVESLGGKFIDTGVSAEGEGGYARELTDEEKAQQAEVLAQHIAQSDAVVTTAAIPGRPAPTIIDAETVQRMKAGSVIIDMAAETGGNCELTEAGKEVVAHGVTIAGPKNIPSMAATHASEMYARNLCNLLALLIKDGEIHLDWDDQVVADSCLTHDGEIRHAPTRERVEGGN